MALCDYRLCDVCSRKTFYDANLNYGVEPTSSPWSLERLGDWKVVCIDCAKTHEVVVQARAALTKDRPDAR